MTASTNNQQSFPNTNSGKFTFYAVLSLLIALAILTMIVGIEIFAMGLIAIFGEGPVAGLIYLAALIFIFISGLWNTMWNYVATQITTLASKAAYFVSNLFGGEAFA